jgi:predicted nucleic acid-binding Zn ribbon protein
MPDRTCEQCEQPFYVRIFDGWRGQRFCSETCRKRVERRRARRRAAGIE